MAEKKLTNIDKEESKKGVLFDLDGVLVDSETEYTRIWNLIDKEFPTGVPDFAMKIKGCNLSDIISNHYPDPEIQKKVVERLFEEEGKMKYRFMPGAENVLKRLKESGTPVAIYTSSSFKKMEHLFRDIPEIKQYFDFLVVGDMVKESKPSPEGYLLAARELGLAPGNWIVVEDSLQGVKAGRASGGKVIGVAGTLPADTLRPFSDTVIESMTDFPFEMLNPV